MNAIETKTHRIRLGTRDDVPQIMRFIGETYRKGHILSVNEEMFCYEFLVGERVNGVLAEHKESGEIEAILMFYQTNETLAGSDVFGGLWNVAPTCKTPMLGYKLIESMKTLTGLRSHSSIGLNPETTGRIFSHIRGQQVGKAPHFYRLRDRAEYRIARVGQKKIPEIERHTETKLRMLQSIEDVRENFSFPDPEITFPSKDAWYMNRRYFSHPTYRYQVVALADCGVSDALLVARVAEANGAKALRIVDFLGNEETLAKSGACLQAWIEEADCEYADMYAVGVALETFSRMGFAKTAEDGDTIIPNYFEPFEQRNVALWYHTSEPRMRIFKADADQDRPNR